MVKDLGMAEVNQRLLEDMEAAPFEVLSPTDEVENGPLVKDEGPADDLEEGDDKENIYDANSGEFTATFYPFSRQADKVFSPEYEVAQYPWRVLLFPQGNNGKRGDWLAVFLDAGSNIDQPFNWQRRADFSLILVHPTDPRKNIEKTTKHTFAADKNDWGFNQFANLAEVRHQGFIVNDTLTVKVKLKVTPYEPYNSKKETGYVGLENQGATCYMNSLLQTLYSINYFRKAVYHMPTSEDDKPESSLPLALQSLFFKLQFGTTSVSTQALTKSFGWDTYDSLMQHDVQELNRVLCEKLEEKMKSTRAEGAINKLFEGHTNNFIECVNIEYKSNRKEAFQDLQLDVKGCKDIYDSFDKYTEVEMLDGNNQYNAEEHGLQDAKKGILFDDFPPVLQLQLKRFEYDFQRDMMVKINDRYEFYEELDLDRDGYKYLSPNADKSVRNKYRLHSVLVHSGGVHGGHYFAFINPDGKQWLKFDDDKVTKEDPKRAIEEQWGGDDNLNTTSPPFNQPMKLTRCSNAYMLVYVRDADWDEVMCDVTEEDIYQHVRARLKAEQEEKERLRREKAEAHLFIHFRVATKQDMMDQIGVTKHFDLVDFDKVKTLKVGKRLTLADLRKTIHEQMGVPVDKQRLWKWNVRYNSTFRPFDHVPEGQDSKPLQEVFDNEIKREREVKLFLEAPYSEAASLQVYNPTMDALLFIKEYDAVKHSLTFKGHLIGSKFSKLSAYYPLFRQMLKYGEKDIIEVYEEVKSEPSVMVEALDKSATLEKLQMEVGDILVVQKVVPKEERFTLQHPTALDYLTYIKNKIVLTFKKLPDPASKDEGQSVQAELAIGNRYDDVTRALAIALGLEDHNRLRLTLSVPYAPYSPKSQPHRYLPHEPLVNMIGAQSHACSSIIYYEVLDLSLPELERLKTIKVMFHNDRTEFVGEHLLRLPKEGTVEDLLALLKEKLGEEYSDKQLRLLEIYNSRIFKVFAAEDKLLDINDSYWGIRAEAIPEDEVMEEKDELLLHVVHTNPKKDYVDDPFLLKVRLDEKLHSIKGRIQAKLGVPDDDFAKWKFSVVRPQGISRGAPEAVEDDDCLAARFATTDGQYQMGHDSYLALEHESLKRKPQPSSRYSTYERPIKINC